MMSDIMRALVPQIRRVGKPIPIISTRLDDAETVTEQVKGQSGVMIKRIDVTGPVSGGENYFTEWWVLRGGKLGKLDRLEVFNAATGVTHVSSFFKEVLIGEWLVTEDEALSAVRPMLMRAHGNAKENEQSIGDAIQLLDRVANKAAYSRRGRRVHL